MTQLVLGTPFLTIAGGSRRRHASRVRQTRPGAEVKGPGEQGARDPRCCAWETQGRHCLLPASSTAYSGRPGYCGFHELCRRFGTPATLEEFRRYQAECLERRYCIAITHYSADYLWPVLVGAPIADAKRIPPQPCQARGCSVRQDQEQAELEQRLRESADAARAVDDRSA
jgi:hypothetical protein